ncbi:lipoprotein insertase outer membrane protein LolB [Neisseriaceae bacterium TC5R-5]|nr:lipoprotein insertase outer membrane protein LolB [Neisseriaceae bacterium TC5R-5]
MLILSACATREVAFAPITTSIDEPFSVTGRLSVNMNGKGYVANFDWQHALQKDQLAINSPLGSTLAKIVRTNTLVTLETEDKTWQAADIENLTQQTLGWPLPLSGLSWWIRGLAVPGENDEVASDGTLSQQGWQIRFIRAEDSMTTYPKRIEMNRKDLNVRVVPQNWN